MQIRLEAFHDRLSRTAPVGLWCHGNEALLLLEAADAFRAKARQDGFSEREVISLERSTTAGQLIGAGTSQSLFGDRKLIELRLPGGRLSKELGEALATVLSKADDSLRVLVTSERLERGVADTAWFKQVDQYAWIVAIYPVERAQLGGWISDRLSRQKQSASRETIELIAERVEGNLMAAQQEIHKLGLLLPSGALEHEQVALSMSAVSRYSPFDLADAALAGDRARAIRSLDGLRAESAPLTLIIWSLADAVRQLYRVSSAVAAGQSVQQAVKSQRAPLPRERLLERAAQRLPAGALQSLLQSLAQSDKMSKGIPVTGHGDAWQLIADVVCALAAPPTPPARSSSKLAQAAR